MDHTINRPINWLERTTESLQTHHPELQGGVHYITERLTDLLLQRLPNQTARALLDLLPEAARCELHLSALERPEGPEENENPDKSIGYMDFMERSTFAIGCSCYSGQIPIGAEQQDLGKKVTDTFLWEVARDLPPHLKKQIEESLPRELKSRMDLNQATQTESQVA